MVNISWSFFFFKKIRFSFINSYYLSQRFEIHTLTHSHAVCLYSVEGGEGAWNLLEDRGKLGTVGKGAWIWCDRTVENGWGGYGMGLWMLGTDHVVLTPLGWQAHGYAVMKRSGRFQDNWSFSFFSKWRWDTYLQYYRLYYPNYNRESNPVDYFVSLHFYIG